MLAAFTGFEDIRLGEDESKPLAQAVFNVASNYDLPKISKEWIDGIALIMVAGRIYGPKAALIKMELDERKKRAKEGEVIPFFNPGKRTQ